MSQGTNGYSPVRTIFGIVAFVACVGYFANNAGVEVWNTTTMVSVLFGTFACCIAACNTSIWSNGFTCFTGSNNCNTFEASTFWNCFGNYAWMTAIVVACINTAAVLNNASNATTATVFGAIASSVFFGVVFKCIATGIACSINDCNVVNNNTTNTNNTTTTSTPYTSANVHESVNA